MTDDVSPTTKSALSGTMYALLGLGGLVIVVLVAALLFRDDDPRFEADLDEGGDVAAVQQSSLNDGWIPPAADVDAAVLIPQAFDHWNLETSDANARNPAFGLTRAGHHGHYTRAGAASAADLFVYPGQEDDAATVDALRERLSDQARFGKVQFREPALVPGAKTLQFDIVPGAGVEDANVPETHGLMAAVDGWLLFARSETEEELVPFVAAYMTTVEADGAAEAPPAPAPGDRDEPIAPGAGRPGN